MGIHRNVIHPKFGNFVLLGTVADRRRGKRSRSRPLEFNPCLECKLCVAACPVGAIAADGHFDFSACYTHNYREFMGGFADWVETGRRQQATPSTTAREVSDTETVSMWQSLSFGAELQGGLLHGGLPGGRGRDRPVPGRPQGAPLQRGQPLQDKEETVYVVPGSDAETYVARRFPHKKRGASGTACGLRP